MKLKGYTIQLDFTDPKLMPVGLIQKLVELGEYNLWQDHQQRKVSPLKTTDYFQKSSGRGVNVRGVGQGTNPFFSAPTSLRENTRSFAGMKKTQPVYAPSATDTFTTTPTTSENGLIRRMALSVVRTLMRWHVSVGILLFRTFRKLARH